MRHPVLFWLALAAVGISCRSEPPVTFDLELVPLQDAKSRSVVGVSVVTSDTLSYEFSRIGAARMDDTGRTFVADGQTSQIVVFNADGTLERVLGSNGSGPGEFRSISGFDVRGDGRISVADHVASRITFFDGSLSLIGSSNEFGRPRSIAVVDGKAVSSEAMHEIRFKVIADDLSLHSAFDDGVPGALDSFWHMEGDIDGASSRLVLVTMMTGIIVVYDNGGNVRTSMRTIDAPDMDAVSSHISEVPRGISPSFLVNITAQHIYVIDTAVSEPFLIDVYSLEDAAYQYSFPIPHPMCGPRYIDGNTVISGCADGTVLKSTVHFSL